MANDKKILSEKPFAGYVPPRLVKSSQGWYILFYHLTGGTWKRERKTFALNRIADTKKRAARAKEIMSELEGRLSDTSIPEPKSALFSTPIIEAIRLAEAIQCQSPKKETRKTYKCVADQLVLFIRKKRMESMAIHDWTTKHAHQFLDELVKRGLKNVTYNNYRTANTTMWNVLIEREYTDTNPWAKIKNREREEKVRRAFTAEERALVMAEIEKDYWLFVLVMLHFMCLIRRTECYRLRFKDFNLVEGYITLSKGITKNKKDSVVTIPDALLSHFRQERFTKNPANYLLFGAGGSPHATQTASENLYKQRHRGILIALKKAGKLPDITGLSLYSWKDTGMTELAKVLRPIELRDHARHASIDQSLAYYHKDKIIAGVKRAFK